MRLDTPAVAALACATACILAGCGGGGGGGFSFVPTGGIAPTPPTVLVPPKEPVPPPPSPDSDPAPAPPTVLVPPKEPVPAPPSPDSDPAPAPEVRVDKPLTQFVDVFIGTENASTMPGLSHSGNNNPGAQTPFGMVSFGPNNAAGGIYGRGVNGYAYNNSSIASFSLTHLNGPGCRGQGALLLMPRTSLAKPVDQSFTHDNEQAGPGFYKVTTNDKITTELTATTRTGMARFTFPAGTAALHINPSRANDSNFAQKSPGSMTVNAGQKTISGMASLDVFCSGTWGQPIYFYGKLDTPFTAEASPVTDAGAAALSFKFAPTAGRTVVLKIGISSVSAENARLNLEAENPGESFDFDKQRAATDAVWNRHLNAVQLDVADADALKALPDDKRKLAGQYLKQFYSALYRTMGGPTVYSDVNGDYRSMKQEDLGFAAGKMPTRATENVAKYSFQQDGKTAGYGTHYSTFSMWDTYRSLTQLQAILFPAKVSDMMQSLVADAQQCGAFPHWVDGSEDTTPMNGDHAPSVIAGAYAFGAQRFDLRTAVTYMEKSSRIAGNKCNDRDGAVSLDYLSQGYTPSTSKTLEMAMTDDSIGRFLAALPASVKTDPGIVDLSRKRSGNWSLLIDGTTRTMAQPKDGGGFTPGSFHEGTEAHYFWMPTYDWSALIEKIGGKEAAVARLHRLMFVDPSDSSKVLADPLGPVEPSAQSLNSNEGGTSLYIGNEPSFPAPWAYNWAGQPKYAQRALPIIMRKTFLNAPGGLPGNDDLGVTSGWYVWAALGMFPTIPSAPGLTLSTPQFSGITLWIGEKKLRIESDQQALLDDVPYIQQMTLNGKPYAGTWLPFKEIANGGTVRFKLAKTPSDWGTGDKVAPPSGPAADYTRAFYAP